MSDPLLFDAPDTDPGPEDQVVEHESMSTPERWVDAGYFPNEPGPRSHDEIAARLDPTTDRDRWDVWDDGGLGAPGGDEW